MSNNFWFGAAAIGGIAWYLLRSKPAMGAPGRAPSDLSEGSINTGGQAGTYGGAPPQTVGAVGGAGDGVSAYGQFPGYVQSGASGIDTDAAPGVGSSGGLDNSRVFDPYAQSAADPQWVGYNQPTAYQQAVAAEALSQGPYESTDDYITRLSNSHG